MCTEGSPAKQLSAPRYQDLEENSSSNMEAFEIRASAALFTDDELQENIVPRMTSRWRWKICAKVGKMQKTSGLRL